LGAWGTYTYSERQLEQFFRRHEILLLVTIGYRESRTSARVTDVQTENMGSA